MNENILEMRGVVKLFPGILANDQVDLEIRKGEIHTLLGENGAGKSTLMNIIYGLYAADAGEIIYKGQKVDFNSPKKAIEMGIGMVHQHFMLIPALTVAENIILGMKSKKEPFLNLKEAREKIRELGRKYNLLVDPTLPVWKLSVGEQQRVEILKALYRGAEILILDEPTAVLIPQETEELFNILRSLKETGLTVIFISHKLNEVLSISDRITILRRGKVINTIAARDTNKEELAQMMVGREVTLKVDKKPSDPGEKVLELQELTIKGEKGLNSVNGISLEIRAGEIFGLAGVDGNGQSELIEALTGLRQAADGRVLMESQDVTNQTARKLIAKGMAHIPEDRHRRGLVLEMSVRENCILETFFQEPFTQRHFLQEDNIRQHSKRLIEEYDVRTPSEEVLAGNLSGGNQQKIILARMLERSPSLLILVHPTRGLDVGAAEYIHRRIIAARDAGCAVFLVSTELEEILNLSDRIGVIYEGRLMGIMDQKDADINQIGLMMAGSSRAANSRQPTANSKA